jgi:hypothetical protein
MPARRSSNPLAGITGPQGWQQGTEPVLEPPAAPQEQDYSITNPDWMLQCRVARLVRQRYGLKDPFAWSRNATFYDKVARRAYYNLQQGKDPWARR